MKKVGIIYCGKYVDSGFGCAGEWRCHKAAALGEGKFDEPSSLVLWIRCDCPGKTVISNTKVAIDMSGIKPDVIHLSSCLAGSYPPCPYYKVEEMAKKIEETFGIPVILGTHNYK